MKDKNNNDYLYHKKLDALQASRREKRQRDEDEYIRQLRELQLEFNIPPKERATVDELSCMIAIVLNTGKSGTKAIKQYAIEMGKSDKWRSEIAKPRVGKSFKIALERHKDNEVILSMRANGIYDLSDILNNSITGALTKLSKQRKTSTLISDLREEIANLKRNLASKIEGQDWTEEAERLRESGMSFRKIGQALGYSKSAVEKALKKRAEARAGQ